VRNSNIALTQRIGYANNLYTKIICIWIIVYKGLGRGKGRRIPFVAPLLTRTLRMSWILNKRVLLLRESTFGVLLNGTDVVGSDIGVPIILYTKIICSWILLYKGLGRGKRRGVHYYLSYRGPYTVVRRR
jgi:hypothetical protein